MEFEFGWVTHVLLYLLCAGMLLGRIKRFRVAGAFGDFFGGGSEPSGTTVVNTITDPPAFQQPFLQRGFEGAETLFDTPRRFFPNSTVIPFSNQTQAGLGAQEARAVGGSPLNVAAGNQIQRTLQGDFLNAENPAFQALSDRVSRDVGSRVNSQFSGGGRYGSGLHAEALTRGLGDVLAPLQFQNYSQERANQLAAAQFAPQLAQEDFRDISALRDVGVAREGQAGAELQDQIDRFNFGETEPRSRVSEFLAQVGGGQFGNQQTTTSPIFSNPAASGISTLTGLAGLGGTLFGQGGIFGR